MLSSFHPTYIRLNSRSRYQLYFLPKYNIRVMNYRSRIRPFYLQQTTLSKPKPKTLQYYQSLSPKIFQSSLYKFGPISSLLPISNQLIKAHMKQRPISYIPCTHPRRQVVDFPPAILETLSSETKMRRWLQPLRSSKEITALCSTPSAISRALIALLSVTDKSVVQSHQFGSYTGNRKGNGGGSGGGNVTRDWLAQIWKQEIRQWKEERPKIREGKGDDDGGSGSFGAFSAFQLPFLNWGADDNKDVSGTTRATATTVTSSTTVNVGDRSRTGAVSAERKLASLLSRTDLVVARDIEWANVLFAFEQESRYIIMDTSSPHSPVGYIRETSNVIFRQLLRTRRPFIAHIIDSHGNEIFRVRRPFWLINSTIYAEVDGKEIGVVHRRWHLWRRIYDLYLGNKQFAVVENPGFWNWTFTLKDEEDNVLAQIDRNWRGIGLELFTDAGQYVIRFGGSGSVSVYHDSDDHIEKFEVARPLTLPERAIALALAVSLDCDYFSRRGGWGLPIMIFEE